MSLLKQIFGKLIWWKSGETKENSEETKLDNYKIPDYGAEASVIIAESYLPKKDGRKEEFLLFFRKDLTDSSSSKPFEEIDYHDLYTSSIKTMQLATMLVFVDDNGNTKIIKNRYGKRGVVK